MPTVDKSDIISLGYFGSYPGLINSTVVKKRLSRIHFLQEYVSVHLCFLKERKDKLNWKENNDKVFLHQGCQVQPVVHVPQGQSSLTWLPPSAAFAFPAGNITAFPVGKEANKYTFLLLKSWPTLSQLYLLFWQTGYFVQTPKKLCKSCCSIEQQHNSQSDYTEENTVISFQYEFAALLKNWCCTPFEEI